jgi:hypothetical protein
MEKEKEKGITITHVGKQEPNIINNWLDENGNIEIAKQVEKEAKDLCEQETLEEVAKNYSKGLGEYDDKKAFIEGAKWQQEQDKKIYSEEDMYKAFGFGQSNKNTQEFSNFIQELKGKNKTVVDENLVIVTKPLQIKK